MIIVHVHDHVNVCLITGRLQCVAYILTFTRKSLISYRKMTRGKKTFSHFLGVLRENLLSCFYRVIAFLTITQKSENGFYRRENIFKIDHLVPGWVLLCVFLKTEIITQNKGNQQK